MVAPWWLLHGAIALCLCLVVWADKVKCKNDMHLNILLHETPLVPCMAASGMGELKGATPSRQQLRKFFNSLECRTLFNVLRKTMPVCSAQSLGTMRQQFESLDFDQMKAAYEQAMETPVSSTKARNTEETLNSMPSS
ncbi:hypothetical protein H310_04753 [Aphanomyces invadans]|uniref:Uncharacterized protein n=1 Tax=Aphanomyces invadans TaxID=157072 RepID=A0A024UE66_9STRA|nr:hypothetical protein H310_04753 [Aphanomyces invadans]ETW04490.1 hypothetical protein H310_04753 [Aphanomyces invadans]|eukprot:XP_008867446.1 hypothetical protein H310_04753 [Aphanomyces invadans]